MTPSGPQRIKPGDVAAAKKRTPHPHAITAMVADGERDEIDQAAAADGLSRAAWARRTLLTAARTRSSTGSGL